MSIRLPIVAVQRIWKISTQLISSIYRLIEASDVGSITNPAQLPWFVADVAAALSQHALLDCSATSPRSRRCFRRSNRTGFCWRFRKSDLGHTMR
jgi:hypothetical protein